MSRIRKWADLSGCWLLDWGRKSGVYFIIGMLVCWLTLNAMAGPGVSVSEQAEAEGPQFSDPKFLDVKSTINRNRNCPSQTQPWVWRTLNDKGTLWKEGDGDKTVQAMPLRGIVAPFLAPNGNFILTLPSSEVPDPESGGWLYRTVRIEQCSFLPTQIGSIFGNRVIPSKDVPVSFVGNSHEPAK